MSFVQGVICPANLGTLCDDMFRKRLLRSARVPVLNTCWCGLPIRLYTRQGDIAAWAHRAVRAKAGKRRTVYRRTMYLGTEARFCSHEGLGERP